MAPGNSTQFQHLLNDRFPIFCTTRADPQIGQDVDGSCTVSVAAENHHVFAWMLRHVAFETFASRFADKMRSPVGIRDPAIVPARLTKWRDVQQDHNLFSVTECRGQDRIKVCSTFIAKGVELLKE